MTVTKADIANQMADNLGLTKTKAKEYLETVLDAVKANLERGESVKLPGFGTFDIRDKSARVGGNLRTGETTIVEARRVVTFKAGKSLKARPIEDDSQY